MATATVIVGACRASVESAGGADDAGHTLEAAGAVAYPSHYRFTDQPDLSLIGCFSNDRPVEGVVDRDADIAALLDPATGQAQVILTPGRTLISQAALPEWDLATAWVAVGPDSDVRARAAVASALGSTTASYALRFELPDDPAAIARSAATAGGQPSSLDVGAARSLGAERAVRAEIGRDALRDEAAVEGGPRPFVVDLYMDRADRVVRVAARPAASTTDTHGQAFGYRTDFFAFGDEPDIPVPDPGAVTPLDAATPSADATGEDRCSIGVAAPAE